MSRAQHVALSSSLRVIQVGLEVCANANVKLKSMEFEGGKYDTKGCHGAIYTCKKRSSHSFVCRFCLFGKRDINLIGHFLLYAVELYSKWKQK